MAREIQEPQLFKFEQQGTSLLGVLSEINTVTMNGKPVPQYVFEVLTCDEYDSQGDPIAPEYTGEMVLVNATEDLKKKIRAAQIGKTLTVEFREIKKIEGSPKPMRVFRVLEH